MQERPLFAPLCIGYILSYRAPDYIRTRSLLRALESIAGVRVVRACNIHRGVKRYLETWRELRCIRAIDSPDAYVLGFRGHEIIWLVRKMVSKKPLIFDALMSPYAAMKEGKKGLIGLLLAPILFRLERHALHSADLVLTDTDLHADFYNRIFEIPRSRILAVPVGAVEDQQQTAAPDGKDDFSVLFYGSFLPLHGIGVIVVAAAMTKDLPIRFDFVGGTSRQARRLRGMCTKLGVSRYTHHRWVPFRRLLSEVIPRATLCLGGPFGGTPQARRVVTGKAAQFLASGKATVIGRIEEDYGFVDRENCILVEQGNADSLATAIRWAYENRDRLRQIGVCGRALYDARLSVAVISERLQAALLQLHLLPVLDATP